MRTKQRLDGCALWVRDESPSDLAIIKECCEDDTYRLSQAGLDPHTVVDIGANIGAFAVQAAALWPQARILAFEPEPENYELLCENIAANGFEDRIVPARTAVGVSGQAYVNSAYGKSRVTGDADWGTPVESRTVAEIFEAEKISRCDVLKIDAEGAEYTILDRAAGEALRRVDYLCMEYHRVTDYGQKLGELLTRLQEDFDLSVQKYTTMPPLPSGTVHGAGMVFGRRNTSLAERELLGEGRADDEGTVTLRFQVPDGPENWYITSAAARSTSSTASRCTLAVPAGNTTAMGLDNGDYSVLGGISAGVHRRDTVGMEWTGLSAGAVVVGRIVLTAPGR
ncbi:FkbM family methyltransferase [Streptomyces sp. NPDC050164]|uniref:FkbM family methyltransferase n=1 Tax=Streptomyces sp. NPDC050164 TaxID=3365605 RepID=UPI00379B10C5